jgi:hypothetical protein
MMKTRPMYGNTNKRTALLQRLNQEIQTGFAAHVIEKYPSTTRQRQSARELQWSTEDDDGPVSKRLRSSNRSCWSGQTCSWMS